MAESANTHGDRFPFSILPAFGFSLCAAILRLFSVRFWQQITITQLDKRKSQKWQADRIGTIGFCSASHRFGMEPNSIMYLIALYFMAYNIVAYIDGLSFLLRLYYNCAALFLFLFYLPLFIFILYFH